MTPPVAPSALLNEEEQKRAVTNCLKRVKRGKVKPFELRVLAFEIRDVGFTPHAALPTLQHLVRELINKASEGYGECAEHCSALCSSLLPILPTFKPPGPAVGGTQKRIDFRSALLNAVQKGFEQCVSSADGMVWLDGPSNNSTAENHPCSSDSGSKRTSLSSIGVVSFVSQLFRYGLLTERILLGCLSGLAKAATASASATHQLDCAIHLLKLAGRDVSFQHMQPINPITCVTSCMLCN